MGNPTVRMHPAGAVIASVLLAMFSALLGVWMAGLYDVLRIGALDTELANRFGYIGEITDSTEDPLLQGISREAMVTIFLVAIIGWPITYAWLVVARRQIGDPNAIEGAFAAALLGAAFGFLWLSMDWAAPRPGHWGLVEQFIRHGNIWVPLTMAGLAVPLLLAWLAHPGDPQTSTEKSPHGHE
ncbi:hypothetical protein [Mycobacteroides abscessus]|uniref:hypothetical protein n=1 Tax=Mycobacteroides abscessus TaxID=36809 RepID=UPI000697EE67|nr:hypothetical protein [Mycobacteroides abscessus]